MTASQPEPFARQVEGRLRRTLGDHFGLRNFGAMLHKGGTPYP